MKLCEVRVRKFRNILDSTPVQIERDVTCVLGKNESGKTAFLQALNRLLPARENVALDPGEQYPAWLSKRDRAAGEELAEHRPICARFDLDSDDIAAVEAEFGDGVLRTGTLILERDYAGELWYTIDGDLDVARSAGFEDDDLDAAIWQVLQSRVPRLFYFDECSALPYSIDVKKVLESGEAQLSDEEITARSLLRLARVDERFLLAPDYEQRKRELENVASDLTRDVLRYWSQNQDLQVLPDLVEGQLKIRIWDQRHSLSLPLDRHSSGFRWFFSFLAAFAEQEESDRPVIILLDEPAQGLHARAQADFLRFIDERLSRRAQVIYSTHSGFMIDPECMHRIRTVQDLGRDRGAQVLSGVQPADTDATMPIRGALAQSILARIEVPQGAVMVNSIGEYQLLSAMQSRISGDRSAAIEDELPIRPVGDVDLIEALVSVPEGRANRIGSIALTPGASAILDSAVGKRGASLLDLFTPADLLRIVNSAYRKRLNARRLRSPGTQAARIERELGVQLDLSRLAMVLLRPGKRFELSRKSVDRFARVFKLCRASLADAGSIEPPSTSRSGDPDTVDATA